jgi:hypothetical protein
VENAVQAQAAGGRVEKRPVPTTPGISLPLALVLGRLLRPNFW